MNVNTNYSQYGLSYNNYTSNLSNTLFGNNTGMNNTASNVLSQLISSSQSKNQVDQSSLSFIRGLKSSANDLKSAISGLMSSSAMSQNTYTSSDSEKMTLQSSGTSLYSYSATSPAKTVKIQQLAQGQQNTGDSLDADAVIDAQDAGYKQIAIDVGGKTHQISFEVKAGDTNKALQEKMASEINRAGIGVKAQVSTVDGESALSIEATGTGTGTSGKFSIKDVSGNAVAITGADKISTHASDAVYYLNGSSVAKTSASNTVDIGGGVKATFNKASEDAVSVSKQVDADKALSLVKEFAQSYNSVYKLARDNETKSGEKLFNSMMSSSRTYVSSLAKIGISFNSVGEMTVDDEKVKKAVADGSLQSFVGSGKNYGYMNQLSRISDDVRYNTAKFVNRDAMYSSLMYSSMGASLNAQSGIVGLLFDFSL